MKGSSFSTGHEPVERTKQLITLMVKKISPKVCPEIYRKQRKDQINFNRMEKAQEWASVEYGSYYYKYKTLRALSCTRRRAKPDVSVFASLTPAQLSISHPASTSFK